MSKERLNEKNLIGKTGIEVPVLCFGTSALGHMPITYGYDTPEARAHKTIERILESSFPFIDTSRNYGDGRSEQRIGQVIRAHGGLPEGAIISTKLDRDMQSGRFDASRARESLLQSLEALHLDKVDILHLHDPEHAASVTEITGQDGALKELLRIRDEGYCKAIGLAAGRVDIMLPLLNDWPFDVLISHNRYTLVNRNAEKLFDLAWSKGVCILNAAPYAGGVFAKGSVEHPRYVYQQASDSMLEPVHRIEALCAKYQVPTGAVALQFSLRDQRIGSTICGVSRPERVEQTLDWAVTTVPDALWDEVAEFDVSFDDPEATRIYQPD